jgi:signal transduction histidine kinase
LFTRFFRSRTATDRAIQGVGLGLTIVQSIIALHGGTIEVSSALGEGTTVTVRLPREAVRAEDSTVPAA